jgi:iron complex transport system ATP-binding protein
VSLHAQDLVVRLSGREIVCGVNLALRPGELAVLVGPNGAGKTTLIRGLAGLLPVQGSIELDGRMLPAWSERERARRIAYLPQGNVFHWPMPVAAIVALGRYPHADAFSPLTAADHAVVAHALAVTATAPFSERPVTALSGGERARVALARALATEAPVLLVDEPIVSLDARHQLAVMALLRDTAHEGRAVLAVVHDLALAARFADRVLVMQTGRIVADAPPAEALSAARIAEVFGVEAQMLPFDGVVIPVPRRPL